MNTTYPVSIKGIFAAPCGRVVLLKNERDEWELPGGRIEPDETPRQCVAREVMEELGLTIAVAASPLDAYLFEVIPGKRVFVTTYACTLHGDYAPVISDEHTEVGLFAPDALPARLPSNYRVSIEAWLHRGRG